MAQSGASLNGGWCEEPNPRERFLVSVTEGQPARAPSRDPTRVSGSGCVSFCPCNDMDPEGVLDLRFGEASVDWQSVLESGDGIHVHQLGELFGRHGGDKRLAQFLMKKSSPKRKVRLLPLQVKRCKRSTPQRHDGRLYFDFIEKHLKSFQRLYGDAAECACWGSSAMASGRVVEHPSGTEKRNVAGRNRQEGDQESVNDEHWHVANHEDIAVLGGTFVMATSNTQLFKSCKSWDILRRVRFGDMFMVDGPVKVYDGY